MDESEIESYPFREVFAYVTVFDLVWIENKHIVHIINNKTECKLRKLFFGAECCIMNNIKN